MSDPVASALEQMRAFGLLVESPEFDGVIHRIDVDGEKRGKKHGWYVGRLIRLDDGREIIAGAYGVWRGAENHARKFSCSRARLSPQERERMLASQRESAAQAERERAERAAQAAQRAGEIWDSLPECGTSAYLQKKGVRAYGVRFSRGAVVVPLRNIAGALVGLQFIDAEGEKKFLTGTAKQGAFHLLGHIDHHHPLILAEGYATAASIHEATGWPVAVCFDCGNLLPVGRALRSAHPGIRLIVAGDDDHEKLKNAGREHGDAAAKKLIAVAVYPRFKDPVGKSDFNDLARESGLDAVKQQIGAAFSGTFSAIASDSDEVENLEKLNRVLTWGDKGLKVCKNNLMLIFEHHPAWIGVLGYDEFQKRIVFRRPPPYGGKEGPITDGDEIEIAAWFERRDSYGVSVPTLLAREASIAVARRHAFHPLRDYLTKVKAGWDGEERIPTFFPDFCGTRNDVVTQSFARNFFISAVARIFRPGCKADLMLVLEGRQGIYKSTLARTLCGQEWFADLGEPAGSKDFFQVIQGRWIVEISELASFARAENAHIKRAISANVDRFRPSYGRNAEDFPRECIFVGTTNSPDWCKDESGARRYMPLWIEDVNIDAIAALRDQLWAEAVVRYERGEKWWELPPEARDEQESRYSDDVWSARIIRWLEGKLPGANYPGSQARKIEDTTISQILAWALEIEPKKQDLSHQTRVGRIMSRLGWVRSSRRFGDLRIRHYERPKTFEPAKAGEVDP
ncbi:MAG: VapE family protein [Sinobacteraceae bacterium]|nr:VapE family protein [Nevskiaceae bacterium]